MNHVVRLFETKGARWFYLGLSLAVLTISFEAMSGQGAYNYSNANSVSLIGSGNLQPVR